MGWNNIKPMARVPVFTGKEDNVGDMIIPFIYTLGVNSPEPTVNMLNLQMECSRFDFKAWMSIL